MTDEVVVENNRPNESADLVRKVAAAIVGLIIIIILVLLAKWLGDRVRERFFPQKNSTANVQVIPPEVNAPTTNSPANSKNSTNPTSSTNTASPTSGSVSTVSAIPATGPNDWNYLILAVLALSGLSTLAWAKKSSL